MVSKASGGHFGGGLADVHARVVDQDVDRAELFFGFAGQPGRHFVISEVGDQPNGIAALLLDNPQRRVHLLTIAAVYAYLGARFGETYCHGLTNPATGTGDQGRFSIESKQPFKDIGFRHREFCNRSFQGSDRRLTGFYGISREVVNLIIPCSS